MLRRVGLWGVVAALALVGSGCKKKGPEIEFLPQAQTPVGQDFKDPEGSFELKIPQGWKVDQGAVAGAIVAVFVPDNDASGTNISVQVESSGAAALDYYSHLNEQNMQRALQAYKPLGEREAANLDGAPAAVARFQFNQGPKTYNALRYLVMNHGEAYQITLTAPEGNLDQYEDAYYALLNTWKFSQPWSETPVPQAKKPAGGKPKAGGSPAAQPKPARPAEATGS